MKIWDSVYKWHKNKLGIEKINLTFNISCILYNHGALDQGSGKSGGVCVCVCVCVRTRSLLGVQRYFCTLVINSFYYFGALVSTL